MPREIIIECVQIGLALRVSAVDAATGTEVTFQAPANAAQETIRRLAADKLKYVQERSNKPRED